MTRVLRRGLIDLQATLAGVLAIFVLIACLFGLVAKVDGLAIRRERTHASNAQHGRMREVADQATANAHWDDARDRAGNRFDLPWIAENIGAYHIRPRRFRFVGLLNGEGRPLFAMDRRQAVPPEHFAGLLRTAVSLVANVRSLDARCAPFARSMAPGQVISQPI